MRCTAMTRKKVQCPIEDATPYGTEWYCHVHHPDKTFRKQVEAHQEFREAKKAERAGRRQAQQVERARKGFPPKTPSLKDRY